MSLQKFFYTILVKTTKTFTVLKMLAEEFYYASAFMKFTVVSLLLFSVFHQLQIWPLWNYCHRK